MRSPIHMKFPKILMTILGIWPLDLSSYKLKLYNAYFHITFTYYILYNITMGATVFISKGNFVETASTLNVTIVYIINMYKILICRSVAIKTIVEEIGDRETLILQGTDHKIKEIFNKHVRSSFIATIFYVFIGSCGISMYYITPIVKNYMQNQTNSPVTRKHLIFSSWFPFDSDEHFVTAYLIQFVAGFYGYAYIVYPGAFFTCILKFIVGQIKILQHVFKNFNEYVLTYSRRNYIAGRNPEEAFIKLCIREHKYLIRLVERLDESIKSFMLLEFIISSFQLSLVVYQILQSSGERVQQVAVFLYLLTICGQLFLFYWNAHDIIIQSTEISQAVFECDWSALDPKVQKMMIFVIQRAQKPIGISIGPIYQVRLDSLIAIFKAIYSYVAVIQK